MKKDVLSHLSRWCGVLACGALLWLMPVARADRAVVVGVNQYPNLTGATLNGCVPDAKLMADTLKKFKFQVTLLTDESATKQGIVDALSSAKANNTQQERFVFYFAGHGTRATNGNSVLLPHDSEEKAESHDIKSDELYEQVNSIPARTRTVLLDSCFSGGMTRAIGDLKNNRKHRALKTRFYTRLGMARSRDVAQAANNPEQDAQATPTDTKVCYFTATRKNEQAGEDQFPDGSRHGVFTYYLVQRLNGGQDIWGNVQKTVGSQVSDWMDDTQHPTLSANFAEAAIFEPKAAAPSTAVTPPTTIVTPPTTTDVVPVPTPAPKPTPTPKPNTVWETYNADNADPDKVAIQIAPNKTTFAVDEQLSFKVELGIAGYLILLERGTSGNVNLIFPDKADIDSAAVQGETTIPRDQSYAFAPNAKGTERIKALLFTSKEKAEALLEKFKGSKSLSRGAMKKDLMLVKVAATPEPANNKIHPVMDFYSADVIFEVVPKGTEGSG